MFNLSYHVNLVVIVFKPLQKYLLRFQMCFMRNFLNMFQVKYESEYEFMRFLSAFTNIIHIHGFPPLGTGRDFVLVLVTKCLSKLIRKYLTNYSKSFYFDNEITIAENNEIARLVQF